MQRVLLRRFILSCLASIAASLICAVYILANPSTKQLAFAEERQGEDLPVASQPSRMAFATFSDDSRILAYWNQPADSSYSFTIVIDPVDKQPDLPDYDHSTEPEPDAADQSAGPDSPKSENQNVAAPPGSDS